MIPQLASMLLKAHGPCRALHVGASDTGTLDLLLLDGCDAWMESGLLPHPRSLPAGQQPPSGPVDALIVEVSGQDQPLTILDRLRDMLATPSVLVLAAGGHARPPVEQWLFKTGWRRHPTSVTVASYPALQEDRLPDVVLYQRSPAATPWPVGEQPADKLRDGSSRADADLVRYALAAQSVRPGDCVVVCSCGAGYGAAMIAAQAAAGQVIGIDSDASAVAYASAHYARPGLSYQQGDPALLEQSPDASVDLVVAMDTLALTADWQAVLQTFRRILKPDGRLIVSVPDQSSADSTQQGFDWATLNDGLSAHFIVEARYLQAAPGGVKLQRSPRLLQQVALDSATESDWIIAVASVNPLEDGAARRDDFRHPAFTSALAANPLPVIDFVAGYDNPYLYRPLVQMGERLKDNNRLYRLACLAMELSRSGSVDQGAALCVAGYQALEHRNGQVIGQLLPYLLGYVEETADQALNNPHLVRWRLSIAFLIGRLFSLRGEDQQALDWFRQAAAMDWAPFSPLLATKAIAACFHAATLLLAREQDSEAKALFQRGLEISLHALAQPSQAIIGSVEAPIPFAMQEIAEVADMGSQCALAIHAWPLLARDRGLFWRQIDVKRFGVVSWAKHLETINAHLQQRLQTIQSDQRAARRAMAAAQ
ncbi:class I SAM-dependent methyltransferase [Insolitispirillum peregrinum]|uniref:Methyltransferase domain-containing protein n=1 Tax=Insolitispirillum peregrinum TaxID=80876 RepID=A0A1N7JU41_9PROT|nr:class I SAM-dependent methyltransferase [Insolitispirillum peregrinum]SIS52863.1 Methyltransferase domain-containing protein [Insolitispirillum peregrinum]